MFQADLVLCPSSGINSRSSGCFQWRMVFRNQDLSTRSAICYWGVIASKSSKCLEVKIQQFHRPNYTHTHIHIYEREVYVYIYAYIHAYFYICMLIYLKSWLHDDTSNYSLIPSCLLSLHACSSFHQQSSEESCNNVLLVKVSASNSLLSLQFRSPQWLYVQLQDSEYLYSRHTAQMYYILGLQNSICG